MGKNVIIFGVDMSSTVHIDNKKKDILILGFGPRQGLDDTTRLVLLVAIWNCWISYKNRCTGLLVLHLLLLLNPWLIVEI